MESYPNGSVPVGGVLSTEHLPLPVFTATGCSTTTLLGGNSNGDSLSEIFLDQYTEVDMSSEWLSSFVEECLSSAGNCLPPPGDFEQKQNLTTTTTTTNTTISTTNQKNHSSQPTKSITKTIHKNTQPTHHHQSFSVPGKPRSQRKRRTTTTTSTFISSTKTQITPLIRWAEHLNPETEPLQLAFSDHPPLLEQAYWLADSELITLPRKEERKEEELKANLGGGDEHEVEEEKKEKKRKKKAELQEEEEVGKENSGGGGGEQQPRRCSHCQAQKTPQWRAGPLGPKTLCNACGVRYFKSGRLLPEYRPAKSPTFVSYKHSNSHKKVLQMRMALHQSSTTTSSTTTTSSSSPSSSPSSTLNNPNIV